VAKLNPTGSALVYATYLGGSGFDRGFGIAVDAAGQAYVTGQTDSLNFPIAGSPFQTTSGGGTYDAFVAKLNAASTMLVYSTYLGGSGFDWGNGIAVDAAGNAYVTGETTSSNFPVTSNPFQAQSGGGVDAFMAKIGTDTVRPAITVTATPETLWPPNSKLVPVTIVATITDTGSGVDSDTVTYTVLDEYGRVQPSGSLTLGKQDSYTGTVYLQAARNGTDTNGRQYTITVRAFDNADNEGVSGHRRHCASSSGAEHRRSIDCPRPALQARVMDACGAGTHFPYQSAAAGRWVRLDGAATPPLPRLRGLLYE
jgi:hypothetical protein